MKIDEVFGNKHESNDWQSRVDIPKMWDIIRRNASKRSNLDQYRLAGEVDKSYAELGQLQKDLFKSMLAKHMLSLIHI